jgi:hypothetical protein
MLAEREKGKKESRRKGPKGVTRSLDQLFRPLLCYSKRENWGFCMRGVHGQKVTATQAATPPTANPSAVLRGGRALAAAGGTTLDEVGEMVC